MVSDLLFNRFAEVALRAGEECGPGAMLFVAVYCNGCGQKVIAHSIEELRGEASDWSLAEEFGGDDFCPRCR